MSAPFNLTCLRFILVFVWMSCTKKSDLEKIPDSSLLVLSTVADAQALLDNTDVMRETPVLCELSADDLYLPDSGYLAATPIELNAYLWEQDIFQGEKHNGDWFNPYQQVYYANSVLGAIPRLSASKEQLNNIMGAALFIRAYAFHNVATEFASLYSEATATDLPGIPLRLTSDPLILSQRASVKETYDRILQDAKDAAALLPPQPDPKRKNRPSAAAAYALVARVYLSMRDYPNAKLYADSCLDLYSALLDFNNVDPYAVNPFSANNEEVLYQSNLLSTSSVFYPGGCNIDSGLYQSFSDQDLRKQLFFSVDNNTGKPVPGSSYSGDITKFSGLAVDEVLLIRAECNARSGSITEALADLNVLLKTRWERNNYIPLTAGSQNEALQLILQERRKELVFRGLRWTDIRRLNMEDASITLKRIFKGKMYVLSPGDVRYVLPIPPDVIAINTGISQNPR